MFELDSLSTFCPTDASQWRSWLEENGESQDRIWLIYYKKGHPLENLTWSEAVDQALCFGWVDSTKKNIDSDRYIQLFSKRKKTSTWSTINKKKIDELEKKNLMHPNGRICIEVAKKNGMWTFLDDVENLVVPADFELVLKQEAANWEFYQNMSASNKKGCLHYLKTAKRQETRDKRIQTLLNEIKKGVVPRPYL